uniref:Putative secreted protein n=1 Tax=Anopheles triannulatus TaxID=58253 RepID=A0A2M4B7K6_9DIPT
MRGPRPRFTSSTIGNCLCVFWAVHRSKAATAPQTAHPPPGCDRGQGFYLSFSYHHQPNQRLPLVCASSERNKKKSILSRAIANYP